MLDFGRLFHRPARIEVSYWDEEHTGSLPRVAEWLNEVQLIPRRGEIVHLPPEIAGARMEGDRAVDVTVEPDVPTGVVTSVCYVPQGNKVTVSVTPSDNWDSSACRESGPDSLTPDV